MPTLIAEALASIPIATESTLPTPLPNPRHSLPGITPWNECRGTWCHLKRMLAKPKEDLSSLDVPMVIDATNPTFTGSPPLPYAKNVSRPTPTDDGPQASTPAPTESGRAERTPGPYRPPPPMFPDPFPPECERDLFYCIVKALKELPEGPQPSPTGDPEQSN
ncbi:hypothetical protein BST61_g11196 [Cercospora zeina]